MKNLIKTFLMLVAVLCLPFSASAKDSIMMATTTSTQDSGLLDYIKPIFEKDTGVELKWVSVGTGKALEIGRAGDADVLLVHAPAAEKKFVAEGYGVDRRLVMYNDFIFVGPKNDPAKVKGLSTTETLKRLSADKAKFISRGDDSGTHKKELDLWKKAELTTPDKEDWYVSLGQGMMAVLRFAAEKDAYTFTDRGTWIAFEDVQKPNPLTILVEGDKSLRNQYSVIMVNPEKHPKVKKEAAQKFIDWWVSPAAQKAIADYKLKGKQLFFPNAGEKD
ncbi:extracellular solute-binding protein [Desulfovibrio litoralis]|uniref:Tungstate transport system substrate-binding protein n=1 Tax=Desulfovibrio litoralis DSM 11393 TaxID=1121455 RepID=A0A1M7SLX2_9BACT|nr:extracellular solute-binding protein [Desulfovibrio litoralis]SHN59479.1 tungstate transport system substrate-binding protein [Desulfovibrio litoralis DSM 11393]